jgi:hypothetical protein
MPKIKLDSNQCIGSDLVNALDISLCLTVISSAISALNPAATIVMKRMAEDLLDKCEGSEPEKRAYLPLLYELLRQLTADTPPH